MGHRNILRFSNRPFESIEQHDEVLLKNINRTVRPKDTLYLVGDFARYQIKERRAKIECKNVFLLMGDHDAKMTECLNARFTGVFDFGVNLKIPEYKGIRQLTLCHWAMYRWRASHYGSIHGFAHSHQHMRFGKGRSMNCGVDQWGYHPVRLETMIDAILEEEIRTGSSPEPNHPSTDVEGENSVQEVS